MVWSSKVHGRWSIETIDNRPWTTDHRPSDRPATIDCPSGLAPALPRSSTHQHATMPGPTTSLWHQTFTVPARPALKQDLTTDVCVVGAGIAGLSVAYALARAGKKVVVLDDGPDRRRRVRAHHRAPLQRARRPLLRAREGARRRGRAAHACESHTAAINRIEEIVRSSSIDCDFARLDGYLFCAPDDAVETLDNELAAAQRAGLSDVTARRARPDSRASTPAPRSAFRGRGSSTCSSTSPVLADAIERAGGAISTARTKVESIEGGTPAKVKTAAAAP